ncbi:DNA alkylation repair protein [Aureibaculum algae]|uniref:DNA alkylation repair protein n=1 Tax=Aureibaculum algae TaxID=2584122 RepID=A0A5B7TLR7_9FLAO|nr:DNA alkylation repair protein [Aureibaculum algae]QCX37315.1 DNA alkylation repair protein [Aureibaculum algae]
MKPEVKLPKTPHSIQKGIPLKLVLDKPAVIQLGKNLKISNNDFNASEFVERVMQDIEPLALKDRGILIAKILREYLPNNYSEAITYLLNSLTPPLKETDNLGLSGLFYMPHVSFVALYGLDKTYNNNIDPFDISMNVQYELTKRFSSEFSIRTFLIDQPERTFKILYKWMNDPDPHVRRLCSEGTRPRLPWAQKINFLVKDPSPSLPILEKLKNDSDLYVRRSVANHIGDIAKDNLDLSLRLCESWLDSSSKELKWLIRHALRHPAKKGNKAALKLREKAK